MGGEVCPSPAHTTHTPRPQQAEGAGGALGANPSQFGVICCPEEQVGGCRENGGSFAWGWMQGGCCSCGPGGLWEGLQQLLWVLRGEKQGGSSLTSPFHVLLLASPSSCVSLCLAGCSKCGCSALVPCSIPWVSSAGASLAARGCSWLGAGDVEPQNQRCAALQSPVPCQHPAP